MFIKKTNKHLCFFFENFLTIYNFFQLHVYKKLIDIYIIQKILNMYVFMDEFFKIKNIHDFLFL